MTKSNQKGHNLKTAALTAILGLALSYTAKAIPSLQLDASPATYDGTSETTISTAPTFTLYALLNGLTPLAGDTYYIAAAIQPAQTTGASLGSFTFGTTPVAVTSDMAFGKPTGMQPHGVYPTFYKLFAFTWNLANKFNDYDVSLVTGNHTGPVANSSGNSLYMSFNVDVSSLAPGHTLWFDLVALDANGNVVDIEPFSHAAQNGAGVPDGATTSVLLGMGLCAVGVLRRTLPKAAKA